MLNGITNFLKFIYENWTTILVIIALAVASFKKVQNFLSKTDAEKIRIAKAQIKEIILKLVTEAELDYEEWNKAGSIKRAQVIQQIYSMYPILEKVIDQAALTAWIDELIDTSLKKLHEIFEKNKVQDVE